MVIDLIQSAPIAIRTKKPCDCVPDSVTKERNKTCICKGRGLISGDELVRFPDKVEALIKCKRCQSIMGRGKIGWTCREIKCFRKFKDKIIDDYEIRDGVFDFLNSQVNWLKVKANKKEKTRKWLSRKAKSMFSIIKSRSRWMMSNGVGEESIKEKL